MTQSYGHGVRVPLQARTRSFGMIIRYDSIESHRYGWARTRAGYLGFLRPARKHKNKNANKENGVILMSRACNVEMYDGDDKIIWLWPKSEQRRKYLT